MSTPASTTAPAPDANGGPDFTSGWDTLWGDVVSQNPQITHVMSIAGLIVVVLSILSWAWQVSRGSRQGAAGKPVLWTLLFGSILVLPGVVIPVLLRILEIIAGFVLGLAQKFVGV